MTPNIPITEEKRDKINILLKKYSIRKIAKDLDISTDTVKKYIKLNESNSANI